MRRAFINLLVLLSLMLCAASLFMWAWSQWVDEAWVFEPRAVAGPAPRFGWSSTSGPPAGWELQRIVGSTGGRLVLVELETKRWAKSRRVTTGHVPRPVPDFMLNRATYVMRGMPGSFHQRVPAVWECFSAPRYAIVEMGSRRFLSVSWLVPAAASAVLPAARAVRRRYHLRARARRMNLCVRCGYDLRASPGRCPECGTAVAGRNDEPKTRMTKSSPKPK